MNSPPSEVSSVLNGESSRRKTSNYDSLRQDLELFIEISLGPGPQWRISGYTPRQKS